MKKAYYRELLKQAEPYQYYLKERKTEERGNSIFIEGPLPCVINIPGIETSVYMSDEKEISYVILKTSKVHAYNDDSICEMIRSGIEKADKLIPDLIYSDNDYMTADGRRHTPFFKPDYSPHTLMNSNYIGELFAVRKEVLLDALAGENESVHDKAGLSEELLIWALLLDIVRYCKTITHVTDIFWYVSSGAVSDDIYEAYCECYLRDIAIHIRDAEMKRMGITEGRDASVSIIIPSMNHSEVLIRCIESIKNKTGFNQNKSNEIIIIDNGSYLEEKNRIEEYIAQNTDTDIRYIYEPSEFNYSAMCNRGASLSAGELILFMNDDIEAVSDDFIAHMAGYALCPDVGAVGLRLMYPSGNKIQHIGITSLKCGPTHKLSGYENDRSYYFGINRFNRNCLALTGACLMIGREKFFQAGCFCDTMKVSYNDVDLCVNLYESGLYNVVLADDNLIHYESLARGRDIEDSGKYLRLKAERDLFYERHPKLKDGPDPFYNPNLIQDSLDYRPNVSADYEIRDRLSHVEVLSCKAFPKTCIKAFHDRLKLNVETVSLIPSFEIPSERYIEVQGWSLYLRHDNRMYKKKLLFIAEDGTEIISSELMPKFRSDIGKVFKDEKWTELSGFLVRIPESLIKNDKPYRLALLYEHGILHTKVIVYGDIYESGKLLQDSV